jgi:PAS domain S-box-containing protein
MPSTNRNLRLLPPAGPATVADWLDVPLFELLNTLPLAAVDANGDVVHVNEAGRRQWGRLDGVRLPEEVRDALGTRATGTLEPLPVPVAGFRVLCAPGPDGRGWLLVGYAETGVWEGISPESVEALAGEVAVALFRLRADGVVTYANAEAEAVMGRVSGVLLGRTFGLELLYPEDRHRFSAALRLAQRDGEASTRVRFQHPDGTLRRAEVRLRTSRRASELTAVLLDVTEHDEVTSALLQSEALYHTFLEQSPVGIVHLDAEGIVTFENHRLRTITGEEPEDAWIGRPLRAVHGVDGRLVSLVEEMLEHGQSFSEKDLTFSQTDGGLRTFAVHGAPIRHPEEGIVGAALMVLDVTVDREREHELEMRQRYDAAEQALHHAALTLRSDFAFLEEVARLLGEAARADQGFVLLEAEDDEGFEEEVRWAREPERSLVPLRLGGDDWGAQAMGGVIHARVGGQADTSAAATDLLAATGASEVIALPFGTDASRRGLVILTRSHPALWWPPGEREALGHMGALLETLWGWMRAEARYRHVVTTIEDSLVAFGFDPEGRRDYSFVTRQAEALTGYAPNDLMAGTTDWLADVVHPEDRAAVEAHDRALRDGRESRLVYRIVHCQGTVRWLRESGSASRDPSGRIVVGGILSDVTDQKEVEASLVQAKHDAEAANRMKSTFLATMSHELRTPLGAIKGFAEVLEEEVQALDDPPAEVLEFAGVIRTNASKVLRLVSDLLDLARLQTERLALLRSPVALHPLLERVSSRYADTLEERGVKLTLELDACAPIVLADAVRLEQIADVLLSNAAKFTEAGTVTIRTLQGPRSVVVEVHDTGIGIAEDYLPSVFEPFTQEDNRLNRNYEGSGLGLALAQRLVVAMEGAIAVESRKGEGSTFSVTLPVAEG